MKVVLVTSLCSLFNINKTWKKHFHTPATHCSFCCDIPLFHIIGNVYSFYNLRLLTMLHTFTHVCPNIFTFKTNSTLDLVKLTSPDSAFQPLKNFYIHHWDGQIVQQSQPSDFDFVLWALEYSGEPGTVNCLLSHHNVFYIFLLTFFITNFTLSPLKDNNNGDDCWSVNSRTEM